MHSTPQCKRLMELLRKNPKFPSQKGQGRGGFGGGKNNKGKRGGRGSGGGEQQQQQQRQQQQQEERAPKRGRSEPQQNPKN